MMRILSPHLDDAVLSLGQYLAFGPTVEVITVLAGVPDDDRLTDYDQSCGFTTSREAMRARKHEDMRALQVLYGPLFRHLGFFDGQYADRDQRAEITDAIEGMYSPEELMFAPLGIGHPDHRLVAQCAREAVKRHEGERPVGLLLYEELPSRVLWPEQVVEALDLVRAEGWTIDFPPWPLEQGDRALKAAAIAEYRSQFPNGADDPCLLVPERCWRVTR